MLKLFFLGLLFSINVYFSGDNNSIINNFSCSICNSSNNLNLARIFYNNNNDNCSCSDCSLNNSNNNDNFSCSDCSLNNSNNNNCSCSDCNLSYIYAMHSSSSCIYCLIEKEEDMEEDMKQEFLIKEVIITNRNASKDIFNNNNNNNKLNNIIPEVQKSIINIYDNNELNNFVRNILNEKNKDNEIINISKEFEDIDMKNEKSIYDFKKIKIYHNINFNNNKN